MTTAANSQIQRVATLVAALSLAGCATPIKGTVEALPDPDYAFDKTGPVLVTTYRESPNALLSKQYVLRVVDAFKARGFLSVISESRRHLETRPIKLVVVVDASTSSTKYTYRSADLGPVQTNSNVHCNTLSNGDSASTNCFSIPTTKLAIVGYSDKIGVSTKRTFKLDAYDAPSGWQVLKVTASSAEGGCNSLDVFDELSKQGIQRMSLSTSVVQDFVVKNPSGLLCKR
jgi:hypothetical protein